MRRKKKLELAKRLLCNKCCGTCYNRLGNGYCRLLLDKGANVSRVSDNQYCKNWKPDVEGRIKFSLTWG